jgi:U32 family peptidase
MNKVELLSPAGNFECLKAAINNGANAVYLGGKNFSARAFANNFSEEELIEAVKYAHLRNVKIYVTLNTLLTEKEFNNAIKMVDFYYENNVDALLIQDLGLFYYIKNKYPDFELHCSTQMHVHNIEGIKNAKKLGFKRVVIARESNLEFIKEATKQDIEIETFVHGAICVSYSGQCLMSSVSKNRSANKGMCAQCCRLAYDLVDEDENIIKTNTKYPISPKDMCLINDIPELISAGVSSFKIEGRLKSAAYVGYITRIYRQAIDAYYNNEKFLIKEEELNNFKVLFNRNFTDDYLFNKNNLFGQLTPNHLGLEIGIVIKNINNYTYIKLSRELNQFDGIRIGEFGCICNMLYSNNLLVNHGDVNDVVAIKTNKILKGKVYKTLDYKLEEDIKNTKDLKLPIDINVKIYADSNVEVKINDFIYQSTICAQKAINAPIDYDTLLKSFSKLNDTEYYLNKLNLESSNAFLTIKQLNQIRRDTIAEYNKFRLNSFKRTRIDNEFNYKEPIYNESLESFSIDFNELNKVVNPNSIYTESDINVIYEFGGILKDYQNKIAYYSLNCSNSYAYEFFKKLGFKEIILSSELKDNDIEDLKDAYKQRNNIDIKPYVLESGNRVLMYIKSNPFDSYIDYKKKYYIKDYNFKYSIIRNKDITEIVECKYKDNNKQTFVIN